MKRLSVLAAVVLIGYICHYDIKNGTIPSSYTEQPAQEVMNMTKEAVDENSKSYNIVKVRAGDTVLSIMEQLIKGPIPVPIDQLIKDFKHLNEIEPEEIQVGKEYKFPTYK
ncbi:hypothetical protein [Metabacillus iocasae]|uniref:LysM domain-containing protein n=1 Tax=Priestia iocasae TaxID=2291674 RepID=A0ABS2QSK4_9BACI|nr:hypothetical protein [Metabacillus iocasae]MBM7701509.1 hypothetical protein [Metabacillus iocasae]